MAYEGKRYSGDRTGTGTLIFHAALLFVPLTIWGFFFYTNVLKFDQECEGHLARAGHANSIETATEELETAVAYIEKQNLTEGYTTVFASLRTPDEDIGFWYRNLAASLNQLKKLPKDITPLERSNVLLKLHETLIPAHDRGAEAVFPSGISRYPHNLQWAACLVFAVLSAIAGFGLGAYVLERD
jgi:hypothetical protein